MIFASSSDMSFFLIDNLFSGVTDLIPKDFKDMDAIKIYVDSLEFENKVRELDKNLALSTSVIVKVPFDFSFWAKETQEKYPMSLPNPYSSEPIQWIFHGHPAQSDESLQVTVERLLGYLWPAELDLEMEQVHVLYL